MEREKTNKILGIVSVGLAGLIVGGLIGGIIGTKISSNTVSEVNPTPIHTDLRNHSQLSLRQTYNTTTTSTEDSVTITAQVSDENGGVWNELQHVTWSMAWASGGTGDVNDYMQMTTNGTSATFTIKKGFSTQIIVTCTSTLDTSIKATATLDYYKRFKSINVSLPGCTQTTMTTETGGTGLSTSHKVTFSSIDKIQSGNWETKNLRFATGVNFDNVGTINNSGNITSIKVSASDSLRQALPSQAPVSSYNVASNNSQVSQRELMLGIFSSDVINNPTLLYDLLNILSTNNVDLVVEVSVNNTYGGTSNVTYYLDVDVEEVKVGGIVLTPPSFIF